MRKGPLVSKLDSKRSKLLIVACGLIAALAIFGIAEANGSPQRVVLTYTPDVSNWGPTGATGIAEIVLVEGEVRFTGLGLPKAGDGTYILWLMNTKSKQSLEIGEPKLDEKGVARLDWAMPQSIPDQQWDLLLLTVEKPGVARSAPGSLHSIAGPVGMSGGGPPAQQLPRTGGSSDGSTGLAPIWLVAVAALAGSAIGAAVVVAVGRSRAGAARRG